MYVCVCNAITDKQIREAAEGGARDLWALQAELGVASNCGSCKEVASVILSEYRGQDAARQLAADQEDQGNALARDPQIYVPAMA